ncbi:pesticidal crystal protein cry22Aa [Clostridium tepidiprofundi DSM 19306]|uniref:Pesticidal crystal protein cry22Aa n=1 Tax=Clostridium tepidiprofundi DSM 19306 TaxID=1121338 RepID=A0A151B2X5_9CLOT|nr:immunoglobulin-like domain-containing protein [Clostridium tepidiprofundi]KYH34289.1 pesticidal crystal protein cry22Aa [Clostridium tepidiprofundi DSM 19306]
MEVLKKITSIFLLLLLTVSLPVFADIPKGTVVLRDKAYDLEYINNKEDSPNIQKIANDSYEIYVKGYDGKWYDNSSGKEISKNKIRAVTYMNNLGELSDYAERDGKKILLTVTRACYIASNQIMVQFNKKVDVTTALDKLNYKINSDILSDKDTIKLMEDGKTVIITLNKDIEDKKFMSNIFVSKNVLDINKNSMNLDYDKNVVVINDMKAFLDSDKELKSDIDILASGYELRDADIYGSVYINADSVRVLNTNVSNKIVINPGKEGTTNLLNTNSRCIDVLSGGTSSIHLYNVKSSELNVLSDRNLRVELRGRSLIGRTRVSSAAILDVISGSFGNVIINIEDGMKSVYGQAVELRGCFDKSVILESGVTLRVSKYTSIPNVIVSTFDKHAFVFFDGNFDKITIENNAKIKIKANSYIGKICSKLDVNIDVGSGAVVKETTKNVKNIGRGIVESNNGITSANTNIDEDSSKTSSKTSHSSSSHAGDGHVAQKPPTANDVTILGNFIVGQILTGNYVYYDRNGDKEGDSIFKWYRADDNSGTNKVKIDGAISKTYKLTSEDEGKYISFEVTPVAKTGKNKGVAVLSDFVGPVKGLLDTEKPVITLKGEKSLELTVGQIFRDPGVTAVDNIDGDISANVKATITDVSGNKVANVDTSKPGTFIIHYNVSDAAGNKADEVTRTVVVKEEVVLDTEEPVITLKGSKVIEVIAGNYFEDPGVTAVDNIDGDISANVKATITDVSGNKVANVDTSKPGTFIIHYNVSDAAGNKADEVTRTVVVKEEVVLDTEKPVITLKGSKVIEVIAGNYFEDPGVIAVDNIDGDISANVKATVTDVSGNKVANVDTSKPGTFIIHYNVSDAAGNKADEVTRTVIVKEEVVLDTEKPVITLKGSKVIEVIAGNYFEDPGVIAVDNIDRDISKRVNVTVTDRAGNEFTKVDTRKPFTFIIHYNVSDAAGNKADEVTRTVIVKKKVILDTKKPVITLIGAKTIKLTVGQTFEEPGVTAVDNIDGDISANVKVTVTDVSGNKVANVDTSKPGTFIIHYNVSDTAGNKANEVTRMVVVREREVPDTEKPVIVLRGEKIVELTVGQTFEDSGATAVDNIDGDISDNIKVTVTDVSGNEVANVDTSKTGAFTIHYNVSDAAGNKADEVTRTVIVNDSSVTKRSVNVKVQGHRVTISIESPNIKDSVTLKIENEKGDKVYVDQKDKARGEIINNKCEFTTELENGRYTAYINAIKNEKIIVRTFDINGTDEEKPVNIDIQGQKVTISIESPNIKNSVTLKIENEKGAIVFVGQKDKNDGGIIGNRCDFTTVLRKKGKYTVYINAIKNEGIIKRTIQIGVSN